MIRNIYVKDKKFRVDSDDVRDGRTGGEADVHIIQINGKDKALKVFKSANDPLYVSDIEQDNARKRLNEYGQKIPDLIDLSRHLPSNIICPELPGYDDAHDVVAYTMRFLDKGEVLYKFSEPGYVLDAVITMAQRVQIMLELFDILATARKHGITLGDFNDLNVWVIGSTPHIIDTDSSQFGKYICRGYTDIFVDPLICDDQLKPVKNHSFETDIYAFLVMWMQVVHLAGPYDGSIVDRKKRTTPTKRILKRLTIFDKGITYPDDAVPLDYFPDDLIHYLIKVFKDDHREILPRKILETVEVTKCTKCGVEHAKGNTCPKCMTITQASRVGKVMIRGNVTAEQFFQTRGSIVASAFQNGKLLYLYHDNGKFIREDGSVICLGDLEPARYGLQDGITIIGTAKEVKIYEKGKGENLNVERFGNVPIFDVNSKSRYWIEYGELKRNGIFGQERIGTIMTGQTQFWVGEKFGFGFYRLSGLTVGFVFNAELEGINDSIKLPSIKGHLLSATCCFFETCCYFITLTQEGGVKYNRIFLIRPNGKVEASAQAVAGDNSWLGGSITGKMAVGKLLFTPTDVGLMSSTVDEQKFIDKSEFPNTAPFITSNCRLHQGPKNGITVVSRTKIVNLNIN